MNTISNLSKVYRDVRIVNSVIADHCIIADDCDLMDVTMAPYAEFGRRNVIRNTMIGYGSYTGTNTTIRTCQIGKYCSISSDVNVYGGGGHDYRHLSLYTDYWLNRVFGANNDCLPPPLKRKTIIGNDVWVGTNVVILDGLVIGDGAVIGAGAVVTKDVAPYTIVAGNPAKEIKRRIAPDLIEKLLELKWWDFPPKIIAENIELLRTEINWDTIKKLEEIKEKLKRNIV